MKVLLNLLAAVAGGQLSRARAFLDRFHTIAPEAELLVIKEQSVLTEYASAHKRTVINVPVGMGPTRPVRRVWWENAVLPGLMRKHGVEAYVTFSSYLPHLRGNPVPSLLGVSNLAPFSPEAWENESALIRLKLYALRGTIISSARRATRVLALSETCRTVLEQQGVSSAKIAVAPNGVDSHWAQPLPRTRLLASLGVNRPFLLYVSHFHGYKNHARLIEAYSRLPGSVRDEHQLVLVGRPYNRAVYEDTKCRVEKMGLQSEIIVVPGEQGDRLKELYQNAALFVFPSLIENSPNILLEAMMAGAPVIASRLEPMPEFGGDAAEYFDALDVTDMSARIGRLLQDRELLARLRERSRAQASRFSWDEFVARVIQNLHAVAARQVQVT